MAKQTPVKILLMMMSSMAHDHLPFRFSWVGFFFFILLFSSSSCLMSFSALRLWEELLPALCTDEETQFPWQQSYLHRHGLILFIVNVVETPSALWGQDKEFRQMLIFWALEGKLTDLIWCGSDLWQLQLASTGFQFCGVFSEHSGVLFFCSSRM